MSNEYHRLLDPTFMISNLEQRPDKIYDAGAYATIIAQFRILSGCTSGAIELQHAAVNEPDAFKSLGSPVSLITPDNIIEVYSNFLRFIRWKVVGSVTGTAPNVLIDLVSKQ